MAAVPDVGRATRVESQVAPEATATQDLYERYSRPELTAAIQQMPAGVMADRIQLRLGGPMGHGIGGGQMVELLGFEEQSIISSLSHNDFNQFTTTYQLLLNKKSRLQAAAQRPKDVQAHKKAQQQQPQQQQPAQQAHHECTIS